MNRILSIACLLISCLCTKAQVSDTSKLEQYCEVLCTGRFLSNKVTVDVDYGEFRQFVYKNRDVKDESGKVVKFNGVVDALNYMARQGWTLQNAYAITTQGQNVYHYLFKRVLNKADLIENPDKQN